MHAVPNVPLVSMNPWYPGQLGVHGSDTPRGMRWQSSGVTLWVDNTHADCSNAHDGTDPEHPLQTIAGAVAKAVALQALYSNIGITIIVQGATYTESVTVTTTAPTRCSIIGIDYPAWVSAAATDPCLLLGQAKWEIAGFYFNCPATDAGIAVNASGDYAYIHDNVFTGGFTGVDLIGITTDVRIENNIFELQHTAGSAGFAIFNTGATVQTGTVIQGNIFRNADNYVACDMSNGVVAGNYFADAGSLYTAAWKLDTTPGAGNNNIVVGNYMPGDYSVVGGFRGGAADSWLGNYGNDLAEPELSDSGITIANPA